MANQVNANVSANANTKEGKAMTMREFMEQVISANISTEMTEYAQTAIAKMDAKNEKRKTTQSKTQEANAEIKAKILEVMDNETVYTSAQISEVMALSTAKVTALLMQLVKDGKIEKSEVKIKGKGKVNGYKKI